MNAIPGYILMSVVHSGRVFSVHRGIRLSDEKKVIVKTTIGDHPSPRDLGKLQLEYSILSGITTDGAIDVLRLVTDGHGLALITEDFGGGDLAGYMSGANLSLTSKLELALRIVDAIHRLHNSGVIHKDINPNNIIINPATGELRIIDFSISTRLSAEAVNSGVNDELEGTPAYISPEQTGRMNRSIDYRTDYYSLGVTLYELFTGSLPFAGSDPMEVVHAQIAKMPVPPGDVNPDIPSVLSGIVLKLMAKMPDDRYQTTQGIAADLSECLESIRAVGTIIPFDLGAHDISYRFQLPHKLYGRDTEIAALIKAFDDVAAGKSLLMLVSGYSGIGKSSLVHEIQYSINARGGHFISGKFDQLHRDLPYASFIQAFRVLINSILSGGHDELEELKRRLNEALGLNGAVIAKLIPEIELVTGPFPPAIELSPSETQNRFDYIFPRFVKVFLSGSSPLVIFLDDLQWADSGSLHLMSVLLSDRQLQHLYLIGAYRDNEVSTTHPLRIIQSEITNAGAEIREINIRPPEVDAMNSLVADTLRTSKAHTLSLTSLIYSKTDGNPFFFDEFFRALYRDKLLAFNSSTKTWQWDMAEIQSRNITDNVAELMSAKISSLPVSVRDVLKLAACIGSRFEILVLAKVSGLDVPEVATRLMPAIEDGLIIPLNNDYKYLISGSQQQSIHSVSYRFSHDWLRQAAYSIIPEEQKKIVHLSIGRQLLAKTGNAVHSSQVFDIVDQFNYAADLVIDPQERLALVSLNIVAGKKAKQSVAYVPALNYLKFGIRYLPSFAWEQNYDQALELHCEAAEAAYLSTDYSESEMIAEIVFSRARTFVDKVRMYIIRVHSLTGQDKMAESVKVVTEVVKMLGVSLPGNPGMPSVLLELIKTKVALAGKKPEALLNNREMTEEKLLLAMRLLMSSVSSVYFVAPNLFPIVVLRMVQLSVRHGNCNSSAYAYSVYGLLSCAMNDIESGSTFGKLGLDLLEKYKDDSIRAKVLCLNTLGVDIYRKHVNQTYAALEDATRIALETGDIEYAAILAHSSTGHKICGGAPLVQAEKDAAVASDLCRRLKQIRHAVMNDVERQYLQNMMGQSAKSTVLSGECVTEEQIDKWLKEGRDRTSRGEYYLFKAMLCYFFGETMEALRLLLIAEKDEAAMKGSVFTPLLVTHSALIRLSAAGLHGIANRNALVGKAKKHIRTMKLWSKYCPENYQHKASLADAELAAITGKEQEALTLYDKAIAQSRTNGYLQDEALANELAAIFLKRIGSTGDACLKYLRDAHYLYEKWGALGKVRNLEKDHPELMLAIRSDKSVRSSQQNATSSMIAKSDVLDVDSIIKATRAISQNIILNDLLSNLMTIVMENAGAQQGTFLLVEEDQLVVKSHVNLSGISLDKSQSSISVRIEDCDFISVGIVNYVARTKENLVLDNALADERFVNDKYLRVKQVRSVMCTPVVKLRELSGVLYLENNLTTGAFTENRIKVISAIASQAAISIENALLYENLDTLVKQRTAEIQLKSMQLQDEKQKSENLLLNILPAETAEELKKYGKAVAKSYEGITVLFADIVGFTFLAEQMDPSDLVDQLDSFFRAIDRISEQHGIEKIKTIGDAYLSASGFSGNVSQSANDMVAAAIEIQRYIEQMNREKKSAGLPQFVVRIGINTGPVVAGVVGLKKFAYDIWGDSVNTAARMEQNCEPGRINISETTFELVKNKFSFEYRGEIEAKGKGAMKMYYLS